MHKLRERTGIRLICFRFTALCLAAVNHDRAGSEVFHLVNAELVNLGTVKPGGTSGLMDWDLVVTLYFGCACVVRACEEAPTAGLNGFAAVANWLKASRRRRSALRTGRLKHED